MIREQLVKRSPKDTSYQRSLAEVINNLGYVYYKRLDQIPTPAPSTAKRRSMNIDYVVWLRL